MDKTTSRKTFLQQILTFLKDFWHWLSTGFHDLKVAFLTSFTRWADPKLQKYRTPSSAKHAPTKTNHSTEVDFHSKNHTPEPKEFAPTTTTEFFDLLKRTPRSVLSTRERQIIAAIMQFPTIKVSEIMLPSTAITYVQSDEILGPLTLDRLYRSGFQHFPVLDHNHKIIGVVHTTSFNNLEIKETRRVADILDPKICYVREDYTLDQALAAFLRTNSYFFLVIDHYERIVGILTYQILINKLLGETPSDNFEHDSDRIAVAKRKD